MKTNEQAAAVGIDSRPNVRQALIEWRDSAMTLDPPPWDGIALLSHAIWWLADDNDADTVHIPGHRPTETL